MPTRRSLSIYRIRNSFGDQVVNDFEDVLIRPDELTSYTWTQVGNFEARLFIDEPTQAEPSWLEFLQEGFGEINEIGEAISYRAVLLVRLELTNISYFAIPFGAGRYLLKPGCFDRGYGLRVALNSIYTRPETGVLDPSRVRSIDIKTVAANTLHTRRQANRRTNFEIFDIDIDRDLLRRITGLPFDVERWGTRVTGSDAVNVNPQIVFSDLGDLLEAVENTFEMKDYEDYFSWIDNIKTVADVDLRISLQDEILNNFIEKKLDQLELAPPELVDWDLIAYFQYHSISDTEFISLALVDFINLLEDEEKLGELSIQRLKKNYQIIANDQSGTEIHKWPVFRCISGEIDFNDKTYLLEDGEFFEISQDFLEDLNETIENIPLADIDLWVPESKVIEGEYNIEASKPDDYLCLDKKTVRLDRRTSAIEICDILTTTGQFIHVKRKLNSSSLSHLFAQGYVSGELLWANEEFRGVVKDKISDAEREKGDEFVNNFQAVITEPFSPSVLAIVYCVIANWKDRDLSQALPFFSKINLRRFYQELQRMGYKVSIKKIDVADE